MTNPRDLSPQEREDLMDESPSFYEESAPEAVSPTPILDSALSASRLVATAEAALRRKGYGVQSYSANHGATWTFVLTAPYTKTRHVFVVDRLENAIPVLRAAHFAAPEFDSPDLEYDPRR